MTHLILALLVATVPARQPKPQPALVQLSEPANDHTVTLYNGKGEQVVKCGISDDGETLIDCKIADGYTLNDAMTAWANAYKNKPQQ